MKPKYYIPTILILLGFLFLPKLASAQAGLESIMLIYFTALLWISIKTILIILTEAIIFWLAANKIFKTRAKFLKISLCITLANVPLMLLLGLLPISFNFSPFHAPFGVILAFFIFSVFIKWAICVLFFKKTIKIFNLLKISLITKLISMVLFG